MALHKKLSQCKTGDRGQVQSIAPQSLAVSLMALGLLPGDEIEVLHKAPLGGPLALKVNGNRLALRKADAEQILIETA
jgi:ferrous iron transport protein A